MADYHEYDAQEVSAILAGHQIEGLADGTFVSIEQESDDFGDVVGTDGEVSRFRTGDQRATVLFTLMSTSTSNQVLSALSKLDKNTPGGAGVGAFIVRDRLGTSLYQASKAWIAKPPDVTFSREPTPREWKIRVANLNRLDGGN